MLQDFKFSIKVKIILFLFMIITTPNRYGDDVPGTKRGTVRGRTNETTFIREVPCVVDHYVVMRILM